MAIRLHAGKYIRYDAWLTLYITREVRMSEPDIPQKSPYILELEAGTYYWCACGKSADQPFCDGSHTDTEFEPVEFTGPIVLSSYPLKATVL